MEFRMVGYQTTVLNNITTTLGETKIINATMKAEPVSLDEVAISADAPKSGHDNELSGATTSISSEQIALLPTLDRSLNDVMALTPQAATTSNGLAIGGGNFRQSYVNVDGASFHNAYGIGGNLPAGGMPIALDALERITISVAPFDVRQSGFTGGVVNAVTKSGGNELKLNIYNFFTCSQLNGTEYGGPDAQGRYPDRLRLTRTLENTTGFSVGGHIVKNKLFYFLNFEYQAEIDQGQDRYARDNTSMSWGGSTQYNRPTVGKMDTIRNYLIDTYGYDPGAYQDYSFSTPDYRLLARLDWNINENNRLQVRYSNVKHEFFTSPSNSITPFSSSLYNRNSYGRDSRYSLYFESSCYYQQQNHQSVAAELDSRFFDGTMHNTLRAVYSMQHEPRIMTRSVFPTVDILEMLEDSTKAVYTSFGPDPFTYGTGSTVHTFIATDELSYHKGIHNLLGGVQFEMDKTINRFMQGGAGYYVYNSWDDFVNQATPAAFTITFGNNPTYQQASPSFNYMLNSLYFQDEMNLSDRFSLTAGLRLELPYYPSIDFNRNHEFDSLAALSSTFSGLTTADMPQAKLNYSPRLGFNWDILDNDRLTLRGGTGLYTGRLPLVWIVTELSNSNVAQNQYVAYNTDISFYSDVQSIIENNKDKLFVGELPAPQYATIMDKSLKMPQAWKSSLELEALLPGGINGGIEALFSKDITSVAVTRLGITMNDSIQLPGEPTKRAHWVSEGINNSVNGSVTPYYITNSEANGYYYSVTTRLAKQFDFGLGLSASYTYSNGKNVIDGIGDQVMSAFGNNTYGVHGSNSHELGYSSYVAPHRLLFQTSWSWQSGPRSSETICLYYDGYNHAYIGKYSYTRYSYTMTSNVNGDGGANSLAYIPTEEQLFASDSPYTNPDEFNEFIKADKYLNAHRGEFAQRGGAIAPWRHTFNLKYERTIALNDGQKISLGVDVKNIANLLYRGWGNMQQLSSGDIIKLNGKGTAAEPYTYTFTNPTWNDYANLLSTWSAMFNLRYSF